MSVKRRNFFKTTFLFSLGFLFKSPINALSKNIYNATKFKRVRPGDPLWPSDKAWQQLNEQVNGKLLKIISPVKACKNSADKEDYKQLLKSLKNPYFISDNPALTQTSGWVDAWRSEPSVYAVAATNADDIVAAVNFANKNNLRLVVKGGGHSYQGTSNSADSLLIWTRQMNKIELHDNFIPANAAAGETSYPAVSVDAGALWLQVYDEVTTKNGRYVQGGGCTTVGVAGLIQSGGFGSFSKNFGMAAASLLEAEIVTADGKIKLANKYTNPDLFWALKGGGGGSFGVITKVTLKTHTLPEKFGAAFTTIKSNSETAFKNLIKQFLDFYKDKLYNEHWGESVSFYGDNTVRINMVFQGINQQEAKATWASFEDWVHSNKEDYVFESPLLIIDLPAKSFWDVDFLSKYAPSLIKIDDRPNASGQNMFWASNEEEAGQFLYAYHSLWMPSELLQNDNTLTLSDAIFASSRFWTISLHFNKGLAGAKKEIIEAAQDTAMNPAVLNAFALAIIAGEGQPAFEGLPGFETTVDEARAGAKNIDKAFSQIEKLVRGGGSYVSESSYFNKNWQKSFWGSNYDRLLKIKKKHDPDCLFFVRHGIGTETWSDDGFTKLA